MPVAQRVLQRVRAQQPSVRTIPAPVGGWNARDSLDQMEETDAILLDNWFPGLGRVEQRGGFTKFVQGIGLANTSDLADVETVAEYHAGATRAMLAAGGVKTQASGTNLLLHTREFDDGVWVKARLNPVNANAATAADGTITADELIEDTDTGEHYTDQTFAVTISVVYTLSIYVKPASGARTLRLRTHTAVSASVDIDPATGTLSSITNCTAVTSVAANGLYRVAMTVTAASTANLGCRVQMYPTGGSTVYTGDNTSGLHVSDVQLEVGSSATSVMISGATQGSRSAGDINEIWSVSPTIARLATGFTNNRWQHANFNGSMGLVNGADAPQTFDGSTIAAMTVSGSGLTVSNLVGINVFKSRTYFWENSSQDFWYSAVNALGGTLTKFPLSRVAQFGGNLVAMGTWTVDGGAGVDDLAVFFMSSGDTIVYQGSDPGSATAWALVGVFRMGAPINVRGVAKFGPDMIVATRDGYQPLSKVLPLGRGRSESVSDKIRGAVIEQAFATGDEFGWQIVLYPKGNMALFNYPTSTAGVYEQHVVNLTTGAWCRFKGMNARCFVLFDDKLYFGGGSGIVYLADNGASDDGDNIEADCQQANTYLGSRARLKQVTMVRPVLASDGDLPLSVAINADFSDKVRPFVTSTFTSGGADWDTAEWDVAEWAGGIQSKPRWLVASGQGYSFSLRLRLRTSAQRVYWYSTGWAFKPGGVL
jgi:hypothetical protein